MELMYQQATSRAEWMTEFVMFLHSFILFICVRTLMMGRHIEHHQSINSLVTMKNMLR